MLQLNPEPSSHVDLAVTTTILRASGRSRRAGRAGGRPPYQGAKQDQLPAGTLANLDLRVLHCAWSSHLRPVRARVRCPHRAVAGGRPRRHRHRGAARQSSWRRAAAVHHPIHGRSSEPALSTRVLHARLERGHRIRGAERRRTRHRHRDRPMATPAALRHRVFSDCRDNLGARCARCVAEGQGIDAGRRARTTVLLRIGMGSLHRAARAVDPLEGPALKLPPRMP